MGPLISPWYQLLASLVGWCQSQWVPIVLDFTLYCRREATPCVYSDQHRISFFCFQFPQAASCVTLYTLHSFLLLPFNQSICCLEIPTNLDCHTLGSTGSLLSSVLLSPHIYISVNRDASLCLLLIILCGLPSSRSGQWTVGHVARAPLSDALSCSVISWIWSIYI